MENSVHELIRYNFSGRGANPQGAAE